MPDYGTKPCEGCGEEFPLGSPIAKFCAECRKKACAECKRPTTMHAATCRRGNGRPRPPQKPRVKAAPNGHTAAPGLSAKILGLVSAIENGDRAKRELAALLGLAG